jgi:hypothetical protein
LHFPAIPHFFTPFLFFPPERRPQVPNPAHLTKEKRDVK